MLPDLPDGDGGGSGRVPLQAMEHFGHPLLTVDAPHAVESVTVWTTMLLGQPDVRLHPDKHEVRGATHHGPHRTGKPSQQESGQVADVLAPLPLCYPRLAGIVNGKPVRKIL